jgi:hypothetical protein
VVEFVDDKSIEAIPANWIQDDLCSWPGGHPFKW